MSLLLELHVPTDLVEDALDTLASLPFPIDPGMRPVAGARRTAIDFAVRHGEHLSQVENALRARGLLEARVHVCECV